MAGPTPALIALFNAFLAGTSGLHVARLYTISLAGGLVLRFTDADFDISATVTLGNGAVTLGSILANPGDPILVGPGVPLSFGPAFFTYSSGGVRVDQKESKTQAHFKVGTDTDTWVVVLMPRPVDLVTGATFPDEIGGVPFLQACNGGFLDAADFQVDEAYFGSVPTWPIPPAGAVPVGCRTIFAGTVGEVDTTNSVAVITANDYRSLFTLQAPFHVYQAQCRHTLFDAGCQLVAANFAVNGSVSSGSTQTSIVAQGLPRPPGSGTYVLGRIVLTSGLNAGFQRTIKSWDGSFTLGMLNPLPFTVAANDSFVIYPGCNKLLTTCGEFGNTINFGGTPAIPPPESQTG